jgi:2,5-diamino-6-(ribosylamino)-4(3H)-pyrimidinone 5'-phosphate reductase
MNKPYVICHMMTSLDGRIDCKMTENLKGVENYYETLNSLNTDSTLSGKTTAEIEMPHNGKFISKNNEKYNKVGYKKNNDTNHFEIIVDTNGSLKYFNEDPEKPYLIITSENASTDFFEYLDKNNISWICTGKTKIDLKNALEILYSKFNVKSLAVVGGSHINTSFLKEGLLDEISILIGAGIDGRKNFPTVFDGLDNSSNVIQLKLKDVKAFKSNAVWLRYTTK